MNHEQNIIEKHTTALQRDGEAIPDNKRIVRQGRNGFVKTGGKKRERNGRHEWEKRSLAHGAAEESGT